jgi:hypothetical protein
LTPLKPNNVISTSRNFYVVRNARTSPHEYRDSPSKSVHHPSKSVKPDLQTKGPVPLDTPLKPDSVFSTRNFYVVNRHNCVCMCVSVCLCVWVSVCLGVCVWLCESAPQHSNCSRQCMKPLRKTWVYIPHGTPWKLNSPIQMLGCAQNPDPKQASSWQKHVAMNVHGWPLMCTESFPHV